MGLGVAEGSIADEFRVYAGLRLGSQDLRRDRSICGVARVDIGTSRQTQIGSSSGMLDVTETDTEVDARIRLPAGTKRAELHISLEDATGTNLWRNEWSEYTAGGEVRAVTGATLRVQPVSWTTPLLAGTLRGSVDPRECSFAVSVAASGESCLHVSLAKGAAGRWGGLSL